MKTYPLTPSGVKSKLTELYTLSDFELKIQALAVVADFKTWVKLNFDLTAEQDTCLNGMNGLVAQYYGVRSAFRMNMRGTITLVEANPPIAPGYAKWTGNEDKLRVSADGSGNVQVEEDEKLTFEVTYER